MWNVHHERIFPLQDDGTLLYEKIAYEENDELPVCFTCALDNPYEKDRSAPGIWLSFHLLRVYDRAYLMLKKCNDNSNRFYRIGLAVNSMSWCESTWQETVLDFDLV